MVDKEKVLELAKTSIDEEDTEYAVSVLKALRRRRKAAELALANVDKEIDAYVDKLDDNIVYQRAGVKVVDEGKDEVK